MDRTIWHHIRHFKSNIGETTPFSFKGRDVCLFNVSSINGAQPKGKPDHAVIIDNETNRELAHILDGHYFIFAYVANGKCYCYGSNVGYDGTWAADTIDMTVSEDLVH